MGVEQRLLRNSKEPRLKGEAKGTGRGGKKVGGGGWLQHSEAQLKETKTQNRRTAAGVAGEAEGQRNNGRLKFEEAMTRSTTQGRAPGKKKSEVGGWPPRTGPGSYILSFSIGKKKKKEGNRHQKPRQWAAWG